MKSHQKAAKKNGGTHKRPKASKGHPLSEADVGHTLYTGEVAHQALWGLMQVCLKEQLPLLKPGQIYVAESLIGDTWEELKPHERRRMGRCIRSYSLGTESRLHLILKADGKPHSTRRYRLT